MMDMLTIELTTADPAATLLRLQNSGITVLDVDSPADFILRFRIARTEGKALAAMAEKHGEKVKIIRKRGLIWPLRRLFRRPVLMLGFSALLLFSLWMPSHIFFVQVEGNAAVPTAQIVEAAAKCGISFGASGREVRSQKVKNALLSAIPSLQWAGVNTRGCVAVISVRERSQTPQTEQASSIGSIVASQDGIVADITVLRGSSLCQPGQAVKAGQVLISGYQDLGICIRATQAEGDVYAYTNRVLTAVTPTNWQQKQQILSCEKKYSLLIGKKRINFTNSSGILGTTCAKIYSENYLTLPGGFQLPLAVVTETCIYTADQPIDYAEPQTLLQQFSQQYLPQQMQAGEVLQGSEVFTQLEGLYRLDGVYSCREMIGRFRPEENLPKHEND